jgi:2-phosphosulfolactate phosphatase
MEIRILDPSFDATSILDFTVVVDVFRAFSVSYFIAANRPSRYFAVDDIDLAFRLRDELGDAVLVGERGGIRIEGFDFGNSPTEIVDRDFSGRTVIHTTSAGTRGLAAQPRDNEVVVGSFVNCSAIVSYIEARGFDSVAIYCTAEKGELIGEEDYLFADYLSGELRGEAGDFASIRSRLRAGSGKGFADDGFAPASDFDYCMDLDRFDQVLTRKAVFGRPGLFELEPQSLSDTPRERSPH